MNHYDCLKYDNRMVIYHEEDNKIQEKLFHRNTTTTNYKVCKQPSQQKTFKLLFQQSMIINYVIGLICLSCCCSQQTVIISEQQRSVDGCCVWWLGGSSCSFD